MLHHTVAEANAEPGLLDLLGSQARSRTTWQLAVTASAGTINAFFFSQHPSMWWLAVGCGAASAYGLWGLADRALVEREESGQDSGVAEGLLETVRGVALVSGIGCVVIAAIGFMGAALNGWVL
jgi:hypothetical protein